MAGRTGGSASQSVNPFAMNSPRVTILACLALGALTAPAFAQIKDTELQVQRRTLDRQDKVNRPRKNAEELTRGLQVTVKNPSTKATAEGEVEWSILVLRPGNQKNLLSTGKETLKALKAGETATFNVGAVPVQKAGNRSQDMEYQVILKQTGKEIARAVSHANFDQLAAAAEPERKVGKKKGKSAE